MMSNGQVTGSIPPPPPPPATMLMEVPCSEIHLSHVQHEILHITANL